VHQFGLLRWLAPDSSASHLGFSHAYYGAIRHAITVGFISLMIVGVAAKVVPTLSGIDIHKLPGLWIPFLLINTGCTLRVVAHTWTGVTPASCPIAGVSGLLEVLGLAIWGLHLLLILAGWVPHLARGDCSPRLPVLPGVPLVAGNVVGDVLDH